MKDLSYQLVILSISSPSQSNDNEWNANQITTTALSKGYLTRSNNIFFLLVKHNENLPKCQYEYESPFGPIKFACNEPSIKNSKSCFFHDKDHYAEYEQEATKRFEEIVKDSICHNKPLECFGYYLPRIDFTEILPTKAIEPAPKDIPERLLFPFLSAQKIAFPQPVYFNEATFYKVANFGIVTFSEISYFKKAKFSDRASFWGATFSEAARFGEARFCKGAVFQRTTFSKEAWFHDTKFSEQVSFEGTKFLDEAYFLNNAFTDETFFRYTIFEKPNKITFEDNNLSSVSFADSDITKIRFGNGISWGGKEGFTITEEESLKENAKGKRGDKDEDVSLELTLSVYRNLRENYEFRLRYDDAGKFFRKEMELKRNYRHISSKMNAS